MNGACLSSGGSVVALKQVPWRRSGVRRHRPAARRSTPTASWPSRGWSRNPTRGCAERPDHHRPLRADPDVSTRSRGLCRAAAEKSSPLTHCAAPSGALAVPRGAQRRRSRRHLHAARRPPGGGCAVAAGGRFAPTSQRSSRAAGTGACRRPAAERGRSSGPLVAGRMVPSRWPVSTLRTLSVELYA